MEMKVQIVGVAPSVEGVTFKDVDSKRLADLSGEISRCIGEILSRPEKNTVLFGKEGEVSFGKAFRKGNETYLVRIFGKLISGEFCGLCKAPIHLDRDPEIPNAKQRLVLAKRFLSPDERGVFTVKPCHISRGKAEIITIDNIFDYSFGRKPCVKIKQLVGVIDGIRIVFEVGGEEFIFLIPKRKYSSLSKKQRKFIEAIFEDAVSTLMEKLGKAGASQLPEVYSALLNGYIDLDSGVRVANIYFVADFLKRMRDVEKIKRELERKSIELARRLGSEKLLYAFSKDSGEIKPEMIALKFAVKRGMFPETNATGRYVVVSDGDPVFTTKVKVIGRIPSKKYSAFVVEAPLGHRFRDDRVKGVLLLSKKETEILQFIPEEVLVFLSK